MRRLLLLIVALLAISVPPAAFAAGTPAPAAAAAAQSAGVISGKVTSIDYQQGGLTVATSRGSVDVATMPTTSVQSSDPGYHAITDVTRGSVVQIYTARVAGKLVAQIIRLVKR